ncbi:MAG: choice-of-anchor tandem repeat GloVer-containing protein [Bacteroidia bacterium]
MRKTEKIFIPIFFFNLFFSAGKINAQSELWSMATAGGDYGLGAIFKMDFNGNNYSRPYNFYTDYPGASPYYTIPCQATNGKLYGMTKAGGTYGYGVLFSYDATSGAYTRLLDFNGTTNGGGPQGSLIQASNSKLYGMTTWGGNFNCGILFSYDISTGTFTKLKNFFSSSGKFPTGSLFQATDGLLYGMTSKGGNNQDGVLFKFDIATNTFTKIIDLWSIGVAEPYGSLIQVTNGLLFGMTRSGGLLGKGAIFTYDITNDTAIKVFDFNTSGTGMYPYGDLMQASNGKFYGMTHDGGPNNYGTLFCYDYLTNNLTKLLDFDPAVSGAYPYGNLIQASNGLVYGLTSSGGINNKGTLFNFDINIVILTKIIDFGGLNGYNPLGSLMQASNGKLYGMTENTSGSHYVGGTLFDFDTLTNSSTKLFEFNYAPNGAAPTGSLVQATNGKLYGMTRHGGIHNVGTIFSFDILTGTYIKLFDFDSINSGANPYGNLIQASDGKLYGMTYSGGINDFGTIFSYDIALGAFVKIFDFDYWNYGKNPRGSFVEANNGKLYGMSPDGGLGQYAEGAFFSFDPSTYSMAKEFDFDIYSPGATPYGSPILGTDGNLYGLTHSGGFNWLYGTIFKFNINTGAASTVHNFGYSISAEGYPEGTLLQANDGKLYGTTVKERYSGARGTLFSCTTNGAYSVLYDFDGSVGCDPVSNLMQASNGMLYGMTCWCGDSTYSGGVIYMFDPVSNVIQTIRNLIAPDGIHPNFSTFIEIITTGIPENTLDNDLISISPNPFNTTISIKGRKNKGEIILFDVTGKEILKQNVFSEETKLNTEKIAPGFYLVNVNGHSFKVIKGNN